MIVSFSLFLACHFVFTQNLYFTDVTTSRKKITDLFYIFAKYNLYLMNINDSVPGLSDDASLCDNSNVKKYLAGGNTITFFLALSCPINIYQHE